MKTTAPAASTTKSSKNKNKGTSESSSNDSSNSSNTTATAATMGPSPGHAPHMLACLAASGDSGIHSSIHALWTTRTTAMSPDVWQWVVYTVHRGKCGKIGFGKCMGFP